MREVLDSDGRDMASLDLSQSFVGKRRAIDNKQWSLSDMMHQSGAEIHMTPFLTPPKAA